MTEPAPETPAEKRRRTLNVTFRVGETVAVIGLVLAAASFFVGRADRREEAREDRAERAQAAQVQRQAVQQARAAEALVLRGAVEGEGERVLLAAANPSQVIQTQRYVFPRVVRETARQILAGQPQIERAWVEEGLLAERERSGGGESRLPVAITTTFIDDGETRTDTAVYRVGYGVARGALGRWRVELQGVSLLKRLPEGADAQAEVDALWAAERPGQLN